mgnify:FL=1
MNWGIDPVSLNGELLYQSQTSGRDWDSYSVIKRNSLYPIHDHVDTKMDGDREIKYWSGSSIPEEIVSNINRVFQFLTVDSQYLFHYQDIDSFMSIEKYASYSDFFGWPTDAIYILQDHETKQMYIAEIHS